MRPDPRLVQPSTVLALSRTLRAGSAGAAAFAAASLTAAARGALPEGRSGRRDGRFRSNKGMLLIDLNEPHHPHHDQLLNLTHTTRPPGSNYLLSTIFLAPAKEVSHFFGRERDSRAARGQVSHGFRARGRDYAKH